MTYNGWANYETWNVALWIGNDEGLYNMARDHTHSWVQTHDLDGCYAAFADSLRELGGDGTIGVETPDNVAWNDSGLDHDALDEMMGDLIEWSPPEDDDDA